MRRLLPLICLLLISACTPTDGADEALDVVLIGQDANLTATGLRLDWPSQKVRAATRMGLVQLDATGQVVPALAESWIVTEDGSNYIFRLRNLDLPDGQSLDARAVRGELVRIMRELEGTSLGLDLAKVQDIRALTTRVIEIRLTSPMPQLLQLLAQAELGVAPSGEGLGPMEIIDREDEPSSNGPGLVLRALSPAQRGLPERRNWSELVRNVSVRATGAQMAAELFSSGAADVVLGGTLVDLPYADTGPLSRGTIRVEAPPGLFGLDINQERGFLAEQQNREALALAIDRDVIADAFGIGGWTPQTDIIPDGLAGFEREVASRWRGISLNERRALARDRTTAYVQDHGEPVRLSLFLPEGPGGDRLFALLDNDLAQIGIDLDRADTARDANLILRDRVARYGHPRWFLNQFNCGLRNGPCSEEADRLVALSVRASDPVLSRRLTLEAIEAMNAANVFIPLGPPLRWSLTRGGIEGFVDNRLASHPLFPLSGAPI